MKKIRKQIIGKNDIVDLPIFNLNNVKVKVDSGAFTSTIHCSIVKETPEGLKVVFLDKKEQGYTGEVHYFTKYQLKRIRSSNGILQERFVIKGNIILFGNSYKTEFSLSSRKLMQYPVLLGRKLLSRSFLIDTSLTNLSYKQNKITAE